MDSVFSDEQKDLLDQKLNPKLVSTRKGSGNTTLKYIEGHDAIDQANRIFGHGNWAYRPLSCEQTVIIDPLTGEAVGVAYKAQVELIVRGCVAPIVDVGSQPVATWNVEDHIWKSRLNDAKYNKKPLDQSEFTSFEKNRARAVIIEAHEAAEKGAVTDGMKRALRAYGEQYGNGLYGDGKANLENVPPNRTPTSSTGDQNHTDENAATEQQITSIRKLSERLKKPVPEVSSYDEAKEAIQRLNVEYKQLTQKAS